MQPEEWIRYVADNRERLLPQLRERMPDLKFSSIMPGVFPVIYLQRPHGSVELGFLAVELTLDEAGDVTDLAIIDAPDDWDEEISERQ
ncbi:MAG: hypothetical protein ABIL09_22475 [Gemmatimonadota bacterium]